MSTPASQSRSPASRRPRAFTIAEVMIAGTVMALAISTAITTMQNAFLALDSARSLTFASQILQSELERIRLRNWDGITALGVTAPSADPTPVTIDSAFTGKPAIGNRFALTRKITAVNPDLREITLRIAWRSIDGRPHVRFYKTYYGRNGLYDYISSST